MSDLVDGYPEDLRGEIDRLRDAQEYLGFEVDRHIDEIKRLRADNLRLSECESETWKAMKAENERLRAEHHELLAALRQIAALKDEEIFDADELARTAIAKAEGAGKNA